MASEHSSSVNCTKCYTLNNTQYYCSNDNVSNNYSCSGNSNNLSDSKIIILVVIPVICVIFFCAM